MQVGHDVLGAAAGAADETARAAEPILVAHADQADRDFIVRGAGGVGYAVPSTGDPREALARYRAGGLQAVLVDRSVLAIESGGLGGGAGGGARQTPLVLLSRTSDEGEVDRFGREQARAILTPPFQLRALRAVIRSVAKEYV